MDTARVRFETDGGPWVRHNMPCPVNWESEKAVFDMNNGTFQPSWAAQERGWMMVRATGFRAALIKMLSKSHKLEARVDTAL
jgi:hypothetical protein